MKPNRVVILPAVEKLAVPVLGVPAEKLEEHTQRKLDAQRETWEKFLRSERTRLNTEQR